MSNENLKLNELKKENYELHPLLINCFDYEFDKLSTERRNMSEHIAELLFFVKENNFLSNQP